MTQNTSRKLNSESAWFFIPYNLSKNLQTFKLANLDYKLFINFQYLVFYSYNILILEFYDILYIDAKARTYDQCKN